MKLTVPHVLSLTLRAAVPLALIIALGRPSAHGVFAQGYGGPARVEVAPAEERWVAPTIQLVGSIMPQRRSLIASEVEGLVEQLPVEVGDSVRKGDLLCKFRNVPQRFARDEAAARVAELAAATEVVKADLKRWEYEHERTTRLLGMGQGAEKESIDATASYESGKARLVQAEASLRAAEAVLARLEDELERTEVRAPFDGHVVSKMTEVGSWIDKGGPVVELIDLTTARIRLNVPESCIAYNAVGTESVVSVDALAREFSGRVARTVPDGDLQARTFPVDVDIPNEDAVLKAGMFARGSVPSGPADQHIVVPKNAIVTRGPFSYLFVVRMNAEGNQAEMIKVRIVSELLDSVAVDTEGLAPGDSVVVRGNEGMFGPGPVIIMSSEVTSQGQDTKRNAGATSRPALESPLAAPTPSDAPSSRLSTPSEGGEPSVKKVQG